MVKDICKEVVKLFKINTDLAVESKEIYSEEEDMEIEGVSVDVKELGNILITQVDVMNEIGERKLNKAIGKYITLDFPKLEFKNEDLKDEISKAVAVEMQNLVDINTESKILIIGLGNWNISPDALGPKVVERVLVTRQYFISYGKESDETMANVAAMSPGVMGVTGIESFDIIEGVIEKIQPNLVIVVDALASRKMDRVSSTIQISNTGISPGSGVGNKKKHLDEESLGIPVIAIGIPTVVNAATIVNDSLDLIIKGLKEADEIGTEFYKLLENMESQEKYILIEELLNPFMGNTIVTPKDIDVLIDDLSIVIANGLNIALHPGINLEDVNRYLS